MRSKDRFADRSRIASIILLPHDIRLHISRWDQADIVTRHSNPAVPGDAMSGMPPYPTTHAGSFSNAARNAVRRTFFSKTTLP